MEKLTSSPYFKSFLAALVVLSFGFIGVLAAVNPQCSHCVLTIVNKAMLGAKMLTGGWIFVGLLYCWDARTLISAKLTAFQFWKSPTKDVHI